ncbi:MAG: hypothetical protein LBE08_07165 [Bifidobacteriaceae bacterium]|nr:hypothetical protein [Bifidobacteriaceae bacterium]
MAFHDEFILVESPGGLMPGVTVESMVRGVSVLRNWVVARVFRELGYIESWGVGLRTVTRTLREAGLGELRLEEEHERLRVFVPIRSHDLSTQEVRQEVEQQVAPGKRQVEHQVEHQVEREVWEPPTTHSGAILRFLADGPASRAEVFAALGVHSDHRAYTRHLVPLIDRALVAMTNPDNPTASTQKYKLTEAGRDLVSRLVKGGSR